MNYICVAVRIRYVGIYVYFVFGSFGQVAVACSRAAEGAACRAAGITGKCSRNALKCMFSEIYCLNGECEAINQKANDSKQLPSFTTLKRK